MNELQATGRQPHDDQASLIVIGGSDAGISAAISSRALNGASRRSTRGFGATQGLAERWREIGARAHALAQ